ncbi:MAG: Hsp20/alpha crystallin family protein [Bacteroidota bacterium]
MFLMNRPMFYNSPSNYKRPTNNKAFRPSVNVIEDEVGYTVQLAVPGYSQADLNITLEDAVLTIASEKTWEQAEDVRLTHSEFKLGEFKRSFVLPKSVEDDKIEAKVEHGILEIKIAKKAKQVIAVA